MTYNEFIQNIIDTRGQWEIPENEYFEMHHIIPKCLGGDGDYDDGTFKRKSHHKNCIWLYPKEHYIAHKLLFKENKSNKSLAYAWWNFHTQRKDDDVIEISAEEYEELRTIRSEFQSEYMSNRTGKNNSNYGNYWSSEKKKDFSESRKGLNNPMFGRTNTGRRGKAAWNSGAKNAHNGISIICIETNTIYQSISKAMHSLNLSRSDIMNNLDGLRDDARGYHFKYAEVRTNE